MFIKKLCSFILISSCLTGGLGYCWQWAVGSGQTSQVSNIVETQCFASPIISAPHSSQATFSVKTQYLVSPTLRNPQSGLHLPGPYYRTPPAEEPGYKRWGSLPEVNSSHLDHLLEVRQVGGKEVGIIHIYSEYPDYKYVGDEDEGIACVDDAARAAVFYLRDHHASGDKKSLHKAELLLEFLKVMQSPNGYFYNFIWEDGSIHKTGPTTVAEPNWWSWRALWAYGEALEVLGKDEELLDGGRKLISAAMKELGGKGTQTTEGLPVPLALPDSSAADQAAILLLGLCKFQELDPSAELEAFISRLADALVLMQVENRGEFPDGAFRSWKNLWHAYGNVQAYALFQCAKLLDRPQYAQSALREVDHFYKGLEKRGWLSHFYVRREGREIELFDAAKFPQIAYNFRPMVWASLEAAACTGKRKYSKQARRIARWFEGDNPANSQVYFPSSGRCYDGINSADFVNRNSGAESTVEALLTYQALHHAKID